MPEALDDRVVLMVATRIVDVGSHVCKVKALVVATSYEGLQVSRIEGSYP